MSVCNQDRLFNLTQVAAALGIGPATASRFAARGDYGKPVVRKGTRRKLYRVEAVEAAIGKPLPASEIATAQATPDYTGPNRSALLLSFASVLIAYRDCLWVEHLNAQGITDFKQLPASDLTKE